ncbi:MAG: hypothetical protein J1E33_06885, partial [Alistipes sp.]|nr:hypothetical protein [Alistipes sp.]
ENGGDAEGSQGDDEGTITELGGVNWTSFTFGGDVNAQLNFAAENGHGVNFKASAAVAGQGDPRWN